MPLPPLWNMQVHEGRLFAVYAGELQLQRGPLLDVRESKEKPNFIKVCVHYQLANNLIEAIIVESTTKNDVGSSVKMQCLNWRKL